MGYSLCWVARRDWDARDAAAALGRSLSADYAWDWAVDDCVGVLPGGWTVAFLNRFEDLDDDILKPLLQGEAIACNVLETVSHAELRGYREGTEVWTVVYSEEFFGDREVRASGAVPAAFAGIRDRRAAEQARLLEREGNDAPDVMFEIPLDLGQALCGFRHDTPIGEDIFRPLGPEPEPPPAPARPRSGWFARLFGRR